MNRGRKFVAPAPDVRQWRQVIAYDDDRRILLALDVLACGHKVRCSRQAGGRKVVGHQEPCTSCTERPS